MSNSPVIKMTRLILHVGPAKCGSTSIQEFFTTQEDPCHENLSFIMLSPKDIDDLNQEQPEESILIKITKLLESNLKDHDILILSHEYLFECPTAIKNICDIAMGLTTTMIVIGYSRRQSDFLVSAYSQWYFRTQKMVRETTEILEKSGVDPILFSGLERQIIAFILDDYIDPFLSHRIFDWHNSYNKLSQLLSPSGALIKCGLLPLKDSENTLLQDFCNKSDLTLRDDRKEASQKIFNTSYNSDVIEAIDNAVALGIAMPERHDRNNILELLSSKTAQATISSERFLSKLKSYIDTQFSNSNYQFCQKYGFNEAYFTPLDTTNRNEILDAIKSENHERAMDKSIIINRYRMLSARMVELCFKLIKDNKIN